MRLQFEMIVTSGKIARLDTTTVCDGQERPAAWAQDPKTTETCDRVTLHTTAKRDGKVYEEVDYNFASGNVTATRKLLHDGKWEQARFVWERR